MPNHPTDAGHASPAAGPGYASPAEAIAAPPETFLYVAALHVGTGVDEPDFLATVDVDPSSASYGQIVHRLPMPNVGDELHHFGWQVCSSACHSSSLERRYLVVPGMNSSRLHVVDVATDPRAPRLHRVIEPEEVLAKTGLSAPHTVHCMPGNQIVLSMLGDADGGDGGGFAVLDAESFDLQGRWELGSAPRWNYDFWYSPRQRWLLSSEWAAPNTFRPGFDLEDAAAGKYGHSIHVWDLDRREVVQDIDLGEAGMVPLEIRILHHPDAAEGFVGAALSSVMWHVRRDPADGRFAATPVIEVESRHLEGFPVPVPGLITDLVVSMDDRYLYFSNWLHGDLRQYDISDPAHPVLKSSVRLGGLFEPAFHPNGTQLIGGPQMLQLSMDGDRLYVTNSLYSSWDNQFYPELRSWLLKLDAGDAGLRLDPEFFCDFAPARAHEIHLPGGDATTEIFA